MFTLYDRRRDLPAIPASRVLLEAHDRRRIDHVYRYAVADGWDVHAAATALRRSVRDEFHFTPAIHVFNALGDECSDLYEREVA